MYAKVTSTQLPATQFHTPLPSTLCRLRFTRTSLISQSTKSIVWSVETRKEIRAMKNKCKSPFQRTLPWAVQPKDAPGSSTSIQTANASQEIEEDMYDRPLGNGNYSESRFSDC
jgi:hypothetical protein